MGPSGGAIVFIADAMLGPQADHKLREAFAVRRRKKGALLVTLAIARDQLREFLLKEGKKHGRRTGLQEEWIGEDGLGSGVRRRLYQGLQIGGRIGDARQYRSGDQARVHTCQVQLA